MIEITEYGVTATPEQQELIRRAVETALASEGREGGVTVLLTTPEEIRSLNGQFRHIDRVTDVLTFPAWEGEELLTPPDGYLGDIAVCTARAEEQAAEYGHPLERELAFLAVHGALHLLGYDHMKEADELVMRERQRKILSEMELTV